MKNEVHRILVDAPMGAKPYDAWTPCRPRDAEGNRIQVTSHVDEYGHVLERWQFSETDVRWYRLEKYVDRRITIKVERKSAVR